MSYLPDGAPEGKSQTVISVSVVWYLISAGFRVQEAVYEDYEASLSHYYCLEYCHCFFPFFFFFILPFLKGARVRLIFIQGNERI